MSIRLTIVLILFLPVYLQAQGFFIKGRVLDGVRKEPLINASVYINNSSKGTVTDENGNFILGPFPPGIYEVVASYVGFTPSVNTVSTGKNNDQLEFQLAERVTRSRNILIIPNETRLRYLEIFKKTLLGISTAAQKSKINNLKAILFEATDNQQEIKAFANEELVIDNPELGYRIHFDIVDFMYNKATGVSYFYGYTRFENLSPNVKKVWSKRRYESYEGSSMHFFRSLVRNELTAEGFSVLQITQQTNNTPDTSSGKVLRFEGRTGLINGGRTMNIARRVYEDSLLIPMPDTVFNGYELRVKDGLKVQFSKNTLLKKEVLKQMFLLPQPRAGTSSGMYLREAPVLLDSRGLLITPMRLFFEGVWAYERLANMLPEDYQPEK